MSRAAVFSAICDNLVLNSLGFHRETSPDAGDATVLVNYDGEQRPSDELFMVITWGPEIVELRGDDGQTTRTSRPLVIWVHCYKEFSTDFARIDIAIDLLKSIIGDLVNVDGGDGYTLGQAEFQSASRDLKDDTYQTICRSVSFKVLPRLTVPV